MVKKKIKDLTIIEKRLFCKRHFICNGCECKTNDSINFCKLNNLKKYGKEEIRLLNSEIDKLD